MCTAHSTPGSLLYVKTRWKVQIFGVHVEAVPKQINYLINESEMIGENGKNCHGPNTAISLLYYFLKTLACVVRGQFAFATRTTVQDKMRTRQRWLTLHGVF